jgi:hypothetical protein
MQTSIEWLWEQIPFEFTSKRSAFEIFEQAKEMHKQEIIDAANTLLYHSTGPGNTAAEQYYTETFKKD